MRKEKRKKKRWKDYEITKCSFEQILWKSKLA